MKIAVHQPNFFPYIGYFDKAMQVDGFVFMNDFEYTSGSYINRNKIKTPDGWTWLTVPVTNTENKPINEVEIAHQRWKSKHLKSISHMYSKCDHYEEVFSKIKQFYEKEYTLLSELNLDTLEWIFEFLNIKAKTKLSSNIEIKADTTTGRIIDLCNGMGADEYLSGATGREYLDESMFEKHNITLSFHDFDHPIYEQRFEGFQMHMSIIDYMMNIGSETWRDE